MAYRNGTYVAFHAGGTGDPINTDIKYYNLMKAWRVRSDDDFYFVNSHDKTGAVRDSSRRETLRRSLVTRLSNSKNVLLILGPSTARDTDWVPFEIRHAVDVCEIPIVAAYIGYARVQDPASLSHLWPGALASRIRGGSAHVIHVPFKKQPITAAISSFGPSRYPNGGGLGIYNDESYRSWGLM